MRRSGLILSGFHQTKRKNIAERNVLSMKASTMLDENDKEVSLTFAKGLSVLLAFDAQDRSITIAEVADKVGLNRAVARRLVRTLEQLGYLSCDRGRYELTPHVLRLSHGFIEGRGISQLILPILRSAAQDIGEAVSFAMLDQTDAVYVAHAFLPSRFTLNRVTTGTRAPLLPTAVGRCILAHLSPPSLEALLARLDLGSFNRAGGDSRDNLLAELMRVRNQGYAVTDSEYVDGVASLAVPVFNSRRDQVVGSVSIIFEHGGYGRQDLVKMAERLRNCAAHVSTIL
jgi:IclR family pca regulon transcriptional regulator